MKARLARRTLAAAVVLFLAVAGSGASRSAWADDVDTSDLLSKVTEARTKLHTAKATFTQERTIGLLSSKVRSRGELTLVMPDRLRWELFAPDEAVYWVGPEGVSYKSTSGRGTVPPGEKRVTAALDDLRTLLGGDLSKLGDRYDLHATDNATHDEVTLAATAKDASHGGLRGFTLTWAKADLSTPLRASLLEAGKDRSDIVFGALQKDAAVDPKVMRPD